MLKRTRVVMLPTNQEATGIATDTRSRSHPKLLVYHEVGYQDKLALREGYAQNYHLYFLSDEPVKEGDWAVDKHNQLGKLVYPKDSKTLNFLFARGTAITDYLEGHKLKKVIATTDTNITQHSYKLSIGDLYSNSNKSKGCFPEPSKAFIDVLIREYNKRNVIDYVDVEYDEVDDSNDLFPGDGTISLKLKVNPKDNTITIKAIKTNWTREEVIVSIKEFAKEFVANTNTAYKQADINKWIELNL